MEVTWHSREFGSREMGGIDHLSHAFDVRKNGDHYVNHEVNTIKILSFNVVLPVIQSKNFLIYLVKGLLEAFLLMRWNILAKNWTPWIVDRENLGHPSSHSSTVSPKKTVDKDVNGIKN